MPRRDTGATARGALLSRWADLIDAEVAEIGRLECLEVGHARHRERGAPWLRVPWLSQNAAGSGCGS